MYFNHAFKKVFVPAVTGGNLLIRTAGGTEDLTPGELGLFDAKTYAAIAAASGNQPFLLVQGNYRTSDKIGKFHGGYQESIKSKMINPRYVSRFFKVTADTPLNQIIEIADIAIECGKTYDLRLDIKGTAAMKVINHNLYRTLSGFSGCCADGCTAPCNGDPVDPTVVYLQWADGINNDPILSEFVNAFIDVQVLATTGTTSITTAGGADFIVTAIADTSAITVGDRVRGSGVSGKVVSKTANTVTLDTASTIAAAGVAITFSKEAVTGTYVPKTVEADITAVVATLRIEVAYVDTVFGNCTFSVSDSYNLEPLFVYASLVDESGDPCAVNGDINSSTGTGVTEVQAPRQASGSGETVLRDLILFMRYLQEPFYDGAVNALRMREIEGDQSMNIVNRAGLYDQVCILHNVPRFNNPSGVFDNDQYLLVINVPTGTSTTTFTNLVSAVLTAGGNTVALEQF